MSVYLDFNASAPIDLRVLDYMIEVYKNVYGNADSRTHDYGNEARKTVEDARNKVSGLLGINKDEVFFTSGATESNNIVFQGLKSYALKIKKKHIITTSIEHKAIIETAKFLQTEGFEVDFVNPDLSGRVSENDIKNLIRSDTLLVSVMHVNNETGIIQPVQEIGEYLSDKEIFFHVDATQSFGKLVPELKSIKYDMLSVSAHKIGGPQGIGALILKKKNYCLPPVKGIMYGGQQEHGLRPGTIPVALVAGFGMACELAATEYNNNLRECLEIRKELIRLLDEAKIKYEINGDSAYSIPNTINICFLGLSSEALMLSTKHFCGISNGSACNSHSYKPSYVLEAMGLSLDRIENSVRISWGPHSNIKAISEDFSNLLEVVKKF